MEAADGVYRGLCSPTSIRRETHLWGAFTGGLCRRRRELEDAIPRYLALNLRNLRKPPKPFLWTKTADQILESGARFYKRISNSGH